MQVWCFGRNLFMGYLLNEKETQDSFNSDNWLKLGGCSLDSGTDTAAQSDTQFGILALILISDPGRDVL